MTSEWTKAQISRVQGSHYKKLAKKALAAKRYALAWSDKAILRRRVRLDEMKFEAFLRLNEKNED